MAARALLRLAGIRQRRAQIIATVRTQVSDRYLAEDRSIKPVGPRGLVFR